MLTIDLVLLIRLRFDRTFVSFVAHLIVVGLIPVELLRAIILHLD